MPTVRAAQIQVFGDPPRPGEIAEPEGGEGREVVTVLASAIHPVTRSIATGRHYSSTRGLPMLAGVDAVVRRTDGRLAYAVAPDTGTMAERIAVASSALFPVPDGADPAVVAATFNPAMSSWLALRARTEIGPGANVVVLGATGTAGTLAVSVAKRLGAEHVVAVGRDRGRLDGCVSLGATATVALSGDEERDGAALARETADADIVLDYLWGAVAQWAIPAVLTDRRDAARVLDWVHIGGVAGADITLPGAWLRSRALRLSGSGLGSIPEPVIAGEFPDLLSAIAGGAFAVDPVRRALSEVSDAWTESLPSGRRVVIVF